MKTQHVGQRFHFHVTPSCKYFSYGVNGKFYAVCSCDQGMHSVVDAQSRQHVAFDDRRDAGRLCAKINKLVEAHTNLEVA